jgi:hypothetical protein
MKYNRGRSYSNTKFQLPNNNSCRGYNKFRSSTTCLRKYYVYEKPNYWSIRHIPEKKQQVYTKFQQYTQEEVLPVYFNIFLVKFKSIERL